MRTSSFLKLLCVSSGLAGAVTAAALSTDAVRPQEDAAVFGRVEFHGVSRTPPYGEDFYSYRPPSPGPRHPDPLRAIVYLEGDSLPPLTEPPPAVIDQKDETFVPHILAVQQGTRVDFRNSDAIYHNVFSFSKTKRFDLGRYPQGRSRSVVFDRLGVARVFCEIHSHMSAFVLVLPHSYFATTDASGGFRIANIPPGRYEVVAWGDPFRPATREITVGAGERAEIDFVLEPAR